MAKKGRPIAVVKGVMHIISKIPQPELVVAAATSRNSSLKYAVSEREQKNISQIFASLNEKH